jgi:hypothetical protein
MPRLPHSPIARTRPKTAPTRRSIRKVGKSPRKPIKVARKPWKFKKTELAECDAAFSKEIIARDGHCMYPGCFVETKLTCSHYIGRGNWNTRFDPKNCIALCLRHHFMDRTTGYEFQKARTPLQEWDGQYTLFMREFLGEEGFYTLLERATTKKSRKEAILETQKKYGLRQPNP